MAIRLGGLEARERVQNRSDFYVWLCELTTVILQVIDATIPKMKPSLHAK